MPSIKDQSTVEAIAREFCSNGRNKEKALKTVGYSDNYAEHRSDKVLSNVGVKQAIAYIDAKMAEKTGFTIECAQQMYKEDRVFARKCNQAGAAVTATTGICRLYGMDKDSGSGKEDAPKPLSAEDLDVLRAMARRLTESELDRPKITKLNTG